MKNKIAALKKKFPKGKCYNAENHIFGKCFECEKIKGYNEAIDDVLLIVK